MNLKQLKKAMALGRIKAITKDVAGRRFLVGYARVNKRSRKSGAIHLHAPIDLDKLVADRKKQMPLVPAAECMPPMMRPDPTPPPPHEDHVV